MNPAMPPLTSRTTFPSSAMAIPPAAQMPPALTTFGKDASKELKSCSILAEGSANTRMDLTSPSAAFWLIKLRSPTIAGNPDAVAPLPKKKGTTVALRSKPT
eukprot:CAMPEP_0204167186 /NCGR_PEP_ID=MMETSP0361-20130328/39647_1 /ASSEMBLY_ACC=CAM_ASM_000343 /TAXON_ID=268821 /ORGANISM="Scrippsiella Hangoei, Strain SHTV-5" /LENGTH=101 /DNA_ID=CAMNT_0051124451 /DNA_START=47 /DNA_END=348 /DNA_ORIENTATION=+